MKTVYVFFCLLVSVALAKSWREELCNGNQECPMKFSGLHFEPGTAKLNFHIHNPHGTPIVGGTATLETEGHGCFFTFCAWQKGPTQTDDTCSYYESLGCHPGSGNRIILNKDESRSVHMDFTPAVTIAAGTSGCCTNANTCGCMLRGTATLKNSQIGEYAKVYMEFTCNLKTKVCSMRPDADDVPQLE